MSGIRNKFLRQSLHTIITRGLLLISALVSGIIVARMLGPIGKGFVTLYLTVPGMVVAFGELGIRQSAAYLIGSRKYDDSAIHATTMALCCLSSFISVVLVIVSYVYLGLLNNGFVLMAVFALTVPIGLFEKFSMGLLLGRKEIEKINYVRLVNTSGVVVCLFLFVWFLKLGILGVGISYVLIGCITVLLVLYWTSRYATIIPKWVSPIPSIMLKKGVVYALSLFVVSLNLRFDVLMLGQLQSAGSVGIYSLGVNFCELLEQIPLAIGFVLFAHATNWSSEEIAYSLRRLSFLTRSLLPFLLFSALCLAGSAKWLIPLLYGTEFMESAKVVWILMPGIFVLSFFFTLQLFVAGQGKPQLALYSFVPGLVLNIVLNLILIPLWDYVGAALSSTISYCLSTMAYVVFFRNCYHVKNMVEFFKPRKQDIGELIHYFKDMSD